MLFASCADRENPASGGPPPKNPTFKDLAAARDNVLFNLEAACNQRNTTEYDKLLDDSFTFFFSPADVLNHNVSVLQWDRASEINATQNMFDRNFTPPTGSPVSSIDLSIRHDEGEDQWQLVPPDAQHTGEAWYRKTVDYFLTVVAGETTYTSGNPIKATFIVRWDTQREFWRIISWQDDFAPSPLLLSAATEASTWGNAARISGPVVS